MLFAAVFAAQAFLLAISVGMPAWTHLGAALAFAALIAATWGYLVLHPASRGPVDSAVHRDGGGDATAPHAAIPGQGHYRPPRRRHLARYVRRLRHELQRYHAIYLHSHDAVLIVEPESLRLVDCNPRAQALLGIRRNSRVHLRELHDEDDAQLRCMVDEVMDSNAGLSMKLKYRTADGRLIPAEVSASRILFDTGNLLLCIARDISEREDATQQIQHLAYHDTLTNLPNRTLLTDRVNRSLARARRTGQIGALLFLDLDKFKRINDSLGHSVGDALLKELAERLRRTLREEDTVARLGGDEFVVLLEGLGADERQAVTKASEVAEKVRSLFAEAYVLDGHELFVTASIGIVTFPRDGDTVDTLLRHADTAMYHAKGAGRDASRLFESAMDEAATSRLRLENELRIGLQEKQLQLYLQPILALRDGRILGAETLVRWQHPTSGLIAPNEFIPYIENSALMLKLDDWVLDEACGLLGRIQEDPDLQTPMLLAINVSHQQFLQPDFIERVQRTLHKTGAEPHRLQFDITETLLIKDARDSVARIHALKQLGIRFALDDFGTGYSSLADLRQLPIDTIKIDRSFVRDIASDPNDAAIVKAILSMARHLGVEVIAEGVETREQLQFLRAQECHFYQGYLGRPPLDARTFREELRFNADLYVPMTEASPATAGGRAGDLELMAETE
jgi:diguanylate cyclase (GGDEF)-like protein/PAS domain S-box-containing protein